MEWNLVFSLSRFANFVLDRFGVTKFFRKRIKGRYSGWGTESISYYSSVDLAIREAHIFALRSVIIKCKTESVGQIFAKTRNHILDQIEVALTPGNLKKINYLNQVYSDQNIPKTRSILSLSRQFYLLKQGQAFQKSIDQVAQIEKELQELVIDEVNVSLFKDEAVPDLFKDHFFGMPKGDKWVDYFVVQFKQILTSETDIAQAFSFEIKGKKESESIDSLITNATEFKKDMPQIANYYFKSDDSDEHKLAQLKNAADITSGIAAGYFVNFVKDLIAVDGPIADGSFAKLVIVKPARIDNLRRDKNKFFDQFPRTKLNSAYTLAHDSFVRRKMTVALYDDKFILDYPTPLDALNLSKNYRNVFERLSEDSARSNSLERETENQRQWIEFQQALVDTFFMNLRTFINLNGSGSKIELVEFLTEDAILMKLQFDK